MCSSDLGGINHATLGAISQLREFGGTEARLHVQLGGVDHGYTTSAEDICGVTVTIWLPLTSSIDTVMDATESAIGG